MLVGGCYMASEHDPTETSWPELLPFASVGWGHHAPLDSNRMTMRVIASDSDWTMYQDSLQPLQPFQPVDLVHTNAHSGRFTGTDIRLWPKDSARRNLFGHDDSDLPLVYPSG